MSYQEKINFLERIDTSLNYLEKPLKARFFWKYTPKEQSIVRSIRKANHLKRENCHLIIVEGEDIKTVKYTTLCGSKKISSEESINNEESTRPYLKLPLGLDKYKKTWGDCDYILARWDFEDKKTKLFWLDAKRLLNLMEAVKKPCEVSYINDKGEAATHVYTKELLAMGLDIEYDLLGKSKALGCVAQVDIIDWSQCTIQATDIQFTSFSDSAEDFTFKKESVKHRKSYWQSWKLLMRKDQSKAIIVTVIETGKEFTAPSAKLAKASLKEEYDIDVNLASISNLLNGRQKTIITKKGRLSVRYAD